MASEDLRGRFLWYELLTTAPDAARQFYNQVVGWGTEVAQIGAVTYPMWTVEKTPIGGMMELPKEALEKGARSHWLCHIGTPSIDETAKQVEQRGGRILKAEDVPTVGRFAIASDPQGAIFSIYTPESEMPLPEGWPRTGDVSWNELAAENWEEAFDFYSGLFGWEKGPSHDMGEMGVYQIYARDDVPLGGLFNKPPEMPSMWVFYALVDDAQQRAERVRQHGGIILNGPMEVPGGDWIVQFADPQGAMFALHSRNPNP